MPTYIYQVIKDDGSEGEVFEVVQKMTDEPLETHPDTGEPVARIPCAPNIGGSPKSKMSNKNLDRLGFTKYENAGGGHFEKKAGAGPDVISSD